MDKKPLKIAEFLVDSHLKDKNFKNLEGNLKPLNFDEAYDARKWAMDNGYQRIIVVTNAFHSRRAHYAFEKVFTGSGVEVEVAAARNPGFSEKNWWLIDKGLASYLTEPLKFAAYIVFEHSPSFVENL